MPVWCTNRSLPWSSGVMNPKPFSSLNHFTVPVAIGSSQEVVCCETREVLKQQLRTLALLRRAGCPARWISNVAALGTLSSARWVRARDRAVAGVVRPGTDGHEIDRARKTGDRGAFADVRQRLVLRGR